MYSRDYELARKRVKKKKGFYTHLAVYVVVNAFIIIVNFLDNPFRLELGPLFPWGIGLALHYLAVFGFPGSGILSRDWEEKEIQKEMEKMDSIPPQLEEKNQEMEKSLELKELRKSWNEKDLV